MWYRCINFIIAGEALAHRNEQDWIIFKYYIICVVNHLICVSIISFVATFSLYNKKIITKQTKPWAQVKLGFYPALEHPTASYSILYMIPTKLDHFKHKIFFLLIKQPSLVGFVGTHFKTKIFFSIYKTTQPSGHRMAPGNPQGILFWKR